MQITFSHPTYKTNGQIAGIKSQNSSSANGVANSTKLLNYLQVDKSMITFHGRIIENAGDEIDELKRILIESLKYKKSTDIPTSVLLGVNDEASKEIILSFIKQIGDAEFVTINASGDNSISELKAVLDTARNRYLKSGQRTVVVIQEAEKAIGMTMAYAKTGSDFELSDEDLKVIENAGNNIKKINYFKSLLDSVSDTPQNQNDRSRSATTILFTTKKPYLIHPDLSSRDGKMRIIIFPEIKIHASSPPMMFPLSYNGRFLEYAAGKGVNLYNGYLGYNKHILWVEPSSKENLNGVLDNLDLIQEEEQFEDINRIQMSKFDGIEKFKKMRPISNYDADGKRIFEMWI